MAANELERRRQRRVRVQLPVRIDYNNNEVLALTKNISMLGTCLDMDKQILPGTRVTLSLDIPKYTDDNKLLGEIKGEGAVVRCDSSDLAQKQNEPLNYELAIFFSNFLPPGEEKLLNYLDYMSKKEEQEVRQWVQQYRSRIKKKKLEIAKKRRLQEKKRAERLAKKALKAQKAKDKIKVKA